MSNVKFNFDGAHLRFEFPNNTHKSLEFDWPIAEVLTSNYGLIVRTSPETGSCENQNVFGINFSGELVWTVEDRKHVYPDSPYTKILIEEGMLKLFNWDGLTVTIDPKTWTEITAEYGK